MTVKELECKWCKTWQEHPNHWDTLDDLEDEIAKITGETSIEVNRRLVKEFKNA